MILGGTLGLDCDVESVLKNTLSLLPLDRDRLLRTSPEMFAQTICEIGDCVRTVSLSLAGIGVLYFILYLWEQWQSLFTFFWIFSELFWIYLALSFGVESVLIQFPILAHPLQCIDQSVILSMSSSTNSHAAYFTRSLQTSENCFYNGNCSPTQLIHLNFNLVTTVSLFLDLFNDDVTIHIPNDTNTLPILALTELKYDTHTKLNKY